MSKILITGGAGFIGSHLCERLIKDEHQVFCLDNFNTYYNPAIKKQNIKLLLKQKNFTLLKIDILNQPKLRVIFQKNNFSHIIHLAAKAGVRASIQDPKGFTETNVMGTLNLLELARQYRVKNFILASSSSVYGNNLKVPFAETDSVDQPISPYAATKKSAELLAHNYHYLYGLNVIALRFFTVFGPRNRPDMAHWLITKALLDNQPITKFGNGKTQRDYTYVGDIVDGITACLNKKLGYEIINLGNSQTITLNKMIDCLEKITGQKAVIKNKPLQPGDVQQTYANIRKAKKLLNWQPKTPYQEGVKKLVEWYKETYL